MGVLRRDPLLSVGSKDKVLVAGPHLHLSADLITSKNLSLTLLQWSGEFLV